MHDAAITLKPDPCLAVSVRVLFVAMVLLLPGCVLEPGVEDSGRDCPDGGSDGPGFLVRVPETVGEGDNRVWTQGYCVSMRLLGGDPEVHRPVHDGVAWFPVGEAGPYRFLLSIQEPRDRYCAYWLETEAAHDGMGVVEVALAYDGVSSCA